MAQLPLAQSDKEPSFVTCSSLGWLMTVGSLYWVCAVPPLVSVGWHLCQDCPLLDKIWLGPQTEHNAKYLTC